MKPHRICLYDRLVLFLLYWISFQDLLLGLLYNLTNNKSFVTVLFYVKDILLVGLFVYILLTKRLNKKFILYTFIYILFLSIMGLVGYKNTHNITSVLGSFRGWILSLFLITIGYNLSDKKKVINKMIWFYSSFLFLIAVLGIIEYILDKFIVSTIPFWTKIIGIGNFITDIKGMGGTVLYGLPGNFYGSYGNGWFSTKTLVSIYGNHLTYAYIMVIPCLYYFYQIMFNHHDKNACIKFIVIYLSLLLSYTRIIILLVTIALITIAFFKSKKFRMCLIFLLPMFLVFAYLKFDKILAYLYDGSTKGHIIAIVNALENLSIVGNGIGTFGIWGNIGTESTYLSCFGQLGIIGIFLYCLFIFCNLKKVRINYIGRSSIITQSEILKLTIFTASIILLITGFISEQLLAYTSIAPFYILFGYILKIRPYSIDMQNCKY